MRTLCTWLAVFLAAAACRAAGLPEGCLEALRRAADSGATWTMERRWEGTQRSLVSGGTVECRAGEGIRWRTLQPFPALVEMRAEGMVFEDEDGKRFRPADSIPQYAEIRRLTDAFAAGAEAGFERLFEATVLEPGEGEAWRVRLVPTVREMRGLVQEVELSGGDALTGAVLRTRDGSVTEIRFTEEPDNGR